MEKSTGPFLYMFCVPHFGEICKTRYVASQRGKRNLYHIEILLAKLYRICGTQIYRVGRMPTYRLKIEKSLNPAYGAKLRDLFVLLLSFRVRLKFTALFDLKLFPTAEEIFDAVEFTFFILGSPLFTEGFEPALRIGDAVHVFALLGGHEFCR